MERKKTDCLALPPGWKKEEVIRKSGLSAGKSDVYYYRWDTCWPAPSTSTPAEHDGVRWRRACSSASSCCTGAHTHPPTAAAGYGKGL